MPIADKQRIAHLREFGQFWTPAPIAEAMVAYLLTHSPGLIFDPAVGGGAFYSALKKLDIAKKTGFYGTDIDPAVVDSAWIDKVFDKGSTIELRDFIKNPPKQLFQAIVANPPYIRHHRIPFSTKQLLQELAYKYTRTKIDGRAGIHIYFLIQALGLLAKNGRLVFIMPSDTCEGVFSAKLWGWIANNYCIERVISFAASASPFPGIDTNPLIFCISNKSPNLLFDWVKVKNISKQFFDYMSGVQKQTQCIDIEVTNREVKEALVNGFSRPQSKIVQSRYKLNDFATVQRGVASGSNEFFFLTKAQIAELEIPAKYFKTAVGRTRDVQGSVITKEDVLALGKKGRPTFLLSLNTEGKEDLPSSLREYLAYGEKMGLDKRALISTRRPWYKMEKRVPPPFLFAYLGRRNARFIKNEAEVVPLTGFLCVYPKLNNKEYLDNLWRLLSNSKTVKNLELVGKSYGSGAIKVEPRALANLPIPDELIAELKISPPQREYDLLNLMDPMGTCRDKRRFKKYHTSRRTKVAAKYARK